VSAVRKAVIGSPVPFLEPGFDGLRLGFGCAGLFQLPTRRRRQYLLQSAFEAGLRHFDLARMYGLGMAEAEVGRFARGREGVTVATKFGIEPPSPRLARLQAPARAALAAAPSSLKQRLKGGGGAAGGAEREPRRYDAAGARAGLETSLRELGRDHVELFFVHDPGVVDLVDLEGIGALCEGLRDEGKIGGWGISGDPDPVLALAAAAGGAVLQVRDDPEEPAEIADDLSPAITFGVLGPTVGRVAAAVAADPDGRRRLREVFAMDLGCPEAVGSLLLQDALARNPDGGVLFSTTEPLRIRVAVASAAAAAREGEEGTLGAFRDLLAEPGAVGAPARVHA
jgi:D-threo-aldose 1-dehydrogenase